MAGAPKAVFLSYASQDAEAAKRICEALRAAGIEVWFDQSELRGGDAWDRQIRKQIHDCALFIPVISANSQARLEGYFRREWKLAADRTHDMAEEKAFLVPLVIDDTSDRLASVPEKFREVQWTRLPAGETTAAFVERLRRLLSPDVQAAPPAAAPNAASVPGDGTSPAEPRPGSGLSWRSTRALVLIATVMAIAGGYAIINKSWLSKRAAADAQSAVSSPPAPTAPGAVRERSIAVLPFADMSEEHDQEYFADGMAEEVLNLLVKVPDLKVIGRTSSFSFKGKADDLRAIGKALDAAYVVEGSVRRSGHHIRVTAQLIDTRDGTHRWSDTYDRDVGDVIEVQNEIAAGLVRALQLEVTTSSHLRRQVLTQSSDGYDSYLRGLHDLDRSDHAGDDEAVAEFRHALEVDPSFVPAAEQLGLALLHQAEDRTVPPRMGFEQARSAASAALKLDPKSAIAHATLGRIHYVYDWDWGAAKQELIAAVGLAATNSDVLLYAGDERAAVGQLIDALHFYEAAVAADPLDPNVYNYRGWGYWTLGRLQDAESDFRRVLQISPTYVDGHYFLGIAVLMEGKTEAALAEMQKEASVGWRSAGLAEVYEALHQTKDADAELSHLESEHSEDIPYFIAAVYAFRGQKDLAFEWLDRAYAQKDTLLWVIKTDPLFKSLRDDRRYNAFLRKMNLPE